MQAEAVLPKSDALIVCEEDDWNGVHPMGKIVVTKVVSNPGINSTVRG